MFGVLGTNTATQPARALFVCLLAPLLAFRPAGIGAVLFHDHGSEGRHFHAVSGSDFSQVKDEHAALHDLEHGQQGPLSLPHVDVTEHSEDCGSLLLVFGESLTVRATNNSRTVLDHLPIELDSANTLAVLDIYSRLAVPTKSRPPGSSIPRGERVISSILLSSNSLLI
ncbi:MAG TPA: hypothetical protein VJZ71_05600 [Phycisphaerae bacterium]|nr:hypothetical protein [Phycisphaerae bacterium]